MTMLMDILGLAVLGLSKGSVTQKVLAVGQQLVASAMRF
jgi:hypothetical protein